MTMNPRARWGWRLCALLPAVLFGLPAVAADRVVIAEEFTWNGCSHCPYAGRALNNLLNDPNNQVADDTLTLVQYHVIDGFQLPWGYSRAVSFYHVPGTPTAWFDGTLWTEGAWDNDQQMYDWYLSEYTTCRAVSTDVTLSVTGVQDTGQTFTIRAQACIEAGGAPKLMRIYMVQVLDHWPTTLAYLRNGFKQAVTTEDVDLDAGECQLVTRSFTFDATSWASQSNIKIIVWAQEPQADSTHADPASIYQAAVLSWPFPSDCNANGVPDAADIAGGASEDCNTNSVPDECDIASESSEDCNANSVPDECDLASETSLDCNTNSIPDECDIAQGTSPDANSNTVPDECEILRGDLNCDGSVNFTDINPFVLVLSNPAAWHVAYPDCLLANGDINEDATIGFSDINPFVMLLSGGG